ETFERAKFEALLAVPHLHHSRRTGASEPFPVRAKCGSDEACWAVVLEGMDCPAGSHIPDRDVLTLVRKRQTLPIGSEVPVYNLVLVLQGFAQPFAGRGIPQLNRLLFSARRGDPPIGAKEDSRELRLSRGDQNGVA